MLAPLLSLLVGSALANPVARQLFAPTVTTTNGTVVGSSANLVDQFLGIPFAQPPVGDLRLRAPSPVKSKWATITATATPRACPQFIQQVNTSDLTSEAESMVLNNPAIQAALNFGEDCLTLNIFRPQGTPANAKLPVVFWIFGGGFELGWTGMYDFTQWIQQSVLVGKPIIAVAVNYRVGGFGFLAGSDLANEHNTNLGLRDQRLGLQWTADNIAAFGGDPSKVTIWGESAGAISSFDHTVINGGDNTYKGKPLFRAAIMNSGSIVPAQDVKSAAPQAVYNQVVSAANCGSASDKLACLRAADYQTFLVATQTVPGLLGYRSLDLSYLPRPDSGDKFFSQSPELSVATGAFTKVPVIIGDLLDEGTLFALSTSNISNNDQLVDYLASYFGGDQAAYNNVQQLAALYPDQPDQGQPAGSPFGTGSNYNIYPEFKRLAAILGDITFTLTRRAYLDLITSQGVTAYSYLADYLSGSSQLPILGTFHGSDLLVLFNGLTTLTRPRATFQNYYISFINNLDPNTIPAFPAQLSWPKYSSSSRQIVEIGANNNSIITDNFRQPVADFLVSHVSSLRV